MEIYRKGRERFLSGLIRTMCGHNAERHHARHGCTKPSLREGSAKNESERAMKRNVDIDIANPDETIPQAALSGCALVPGAKAC
jgi:hypothetical protein